MKQLKFLLIVYLIFLLVGCNSTNKYYVPTTVIVIFENAPSQSSTNRLIGTVSVPPEATVEFVDTTIQVVYYMPRSIGFDTLSVPCYHGYADIIHRNQALEMQHYLLKAGDTVLFTYGENLRPLIKSLISDENTLLYNIPFNDPRAVQSIGYSTQTICTEYDYRLMWWVLNNPKYKDDPSKKETLEKYRLKCPNLDSLQTVFNEFKADYITQLDEFEKQGRLPKVYADYYKYHILKIPITAPFADSMMHYISYHKKVIAYLYKLAPNDATSPQRFDLITADTLLSSIVRKAMLNNIMSSIENGDYWSPYSFEVVQKYRERYEQITGNTIFRQNIINKENVVANGYSTDLMLIGLGGQQYNYNNILTKHKGKVIYVDLWASWCGPCRAGMPEAKLLREAYKNKDVVFLYLAVNDTEAAWLNALKTLELDYLGENYMTLNARDAQFFKEIKQSRIPHFLLYDRSGKLVDTDAPSPHGNEIREQLNQLLKE